MIELGGGIVDQTPYVKRTVDGMLNMLRLLGAIEGDVDAAPKQVVVNEIAGIRPTQGGWLEPLCPPLGETDRGRRAAWPRRQPLQLRDAGGDPRRLSTSGIMIMLAPVRATSSRAATTASWSAIWTAPPTDRATARAVTSAPALPGERTRARGDGSGDPHRRRARVVPGRLRHVFRVDAGETLCIVGESRLRQVDDGALAAAAFCRRRRVISAREHHGSTGAMSLALDQREMEDMRGDRRSP